MFGTIIYLLDEHGIQPVVIGGWSVDGHARHIQRTHGDLDIVVPIQDVAACVHILSSELDLVWKNSTCFGSGCQKIELYSHEAGLVEIFGAVASNENVRFEGLLFVIEVPKKFFENPVRTRINEVNYFVLKEDIVQTLTVKLSQIKADKKMINPQIEDNHQLEMVEARSFIQQRQSILTGV